MIVEKFGGEDRSIEEIAGDAAAHLLLEVGFAGSQRDFSEDAIKRLFRQLAMAGAENSSISLKSNCP